MKKIDIVEFARENGAFFPEDLKYIGDNAHVELLNGVTCHELLFEDRYGYVLTWSFKVDETGKIIPYDHGFKFRMSGFSPDEMRKKLAMVDKAKAAREN